MIDCFHIWHHYFPCQVLSEGQHFKKYYPRRLFTMNDGLYGVALLLHYFHFIQWNISKCMILYWSLCSFLDGSILYISYSLLYPGLRCIIILWIINVCLLLISAGWIIATDASGSIGVSPGEPLLSIKFTINNSPWLSHSVHCLGKIWNSHTLIQRWI